MSNVNDYMFLTFTKEHDIVHKITQQPIVYCRKYDNTYYTLNSCTVLDNFEGYERYKIQKASKFVDLLELYNSSKKYNMEFLLNYKKLMQDHNNNYIGTIADVHVVGFLEILDITRLLSMVVNDNISDELELLYDVPTNAPDRKFTKRRLYHKGNPKYIHQFEYMLNIFKINIENFYKEYYKGNFPSVNISWYYL